MIAQWLTWVSFVSQAYEGVLFREALKHGCYELQKARDTYRVAVGPHGLERDLIMHYIEASRLCSKCSLKLILQFEGLEKHALNVQGLADSDDKDTQLCTSWTRSAGIDDISFAHRL